MDSLLQDLRYAVRRLVKSPGFSLIVVLTLALGIGANSAIFSVINTVLLRPFPYREPERLILVDHFYPSLNNLEAGASAPGYRDLRDKARSFDGVMVQTGWNPALTGMGDPQRVNAARVSGQYFRTLGVPVARGRPLLPEEDKPGNDKVVVISDGLWQRLFGGEADAIGKKMTLNGESYDVVGVMPPHFRDFFNRRVEMWVPLALSDEAFGDDRRTNEFLALVARLKPGVTVERARTDMTAFADQLKQQYTGSYSPDWTLKVTPMLERATGKIRPALLVLLGAVGFVLLIACANVANLLLARAASRSKEVAIRSALGAKRWDIIRQLLAESVVLSFIGGTLGLMLAYVGVRSVVALNPANIPRVDEMRIDGTVIVFTLLVSLVTSMLFGLVPALQASRTDLQETLKEGGRSSAADGSGQTVRRVLVVAEVALALMLLIGAGLLIKSVGRLQGVEPGFDQRNLLTFGLSLPRAKYTSDTTQIAYYDQLLPRIAAVPGVQSVGATSVLPFSGNWSTGSFTVEGYQTAANQPGPWGDIRFVSTDFFKTLRVPLLKGRGFTIQDGPSAPVVAVVDDEMVSRFWPNQDPIGKRVTFGSPTGDSTQWITVVGVVGHTMHEGLDAEARVQMYLAYAQTGQNFGGALSLAVRTAGDPLAALPAVRAAVHSLDRDIPLSGISTMEEQVESSVGQRRFTMMLLGFFAGIALLLASIGIYGVMSYSVTQRSREIGLRMALGAARGNVLRLVIRQGMTLALVGVGIGVLGALTLTRLMQSQLYSVRATDPVTFVAVPLLLAAIAMLATFIPAMRATRVDPAVALRQE
ncbi:MAG: ABC transporter permease [Anaerolineae bacterium]|nr:ABC transporter permease [Gemmatimonadaceae bacterium]